MSAVNVTNVTVLDNPSMFLNPFQFEISYECLVPLKDGKRSINLPFSKLHFVKGVSFPAYACLLVTDIVMFPRSLQCAVLLFQFRSFFWLACYLNQSKSLFAVGYVMDLDCVQIGWVVAMIHFADLEWKLIYVGSAEDEKYDQVLESVLVGPVNIGNYRFVFQVLILSHVSHSIHV